MTDLNMCVYHCDDSTCSAEGNTMSWSKRPCACDHVHVPICATLPYRAKSLPALTESYRLLIYTYYVSNKVTPMPSFPKYY